MIRSPHLHIEIEKKSLNYRYLQLATSTKATVNNYSRCIIHYLVPLKHYNVLPDSHCLVQSNRCRKFIVKVLLNLEVFKLTSCYHIPQSTQNHACAG
jgi:hypothetical protein